jgi:hypothetical protein
MRHLRNILNRIRYKDWKFLLVWANDVTGWADGNPCLQVEFDAVSSETGVVETQRGRRWILRRDMTAGEVAQTALMAVLAAEEHEAREAFTYRGQAVFGPHQDVEALAHGLATERRPDPIVALAHARGEQPEDRTEERLNAIEALDPWRDLI